MREEVTTKEGVSITFPKQRLDHALKRPNLIAVMLIVDEDSRIISAVDRRGTIKDKEGNDPSVPQLNHWYFYAWNPVAGSNLPLSAYQLKDGVWTAQGPSQYPKTNQPGKEEYSILLWVTEGNGALYLASGPGGPLAIDNENPLAPGKPVDGHYLVYAVEDKISPPGCYLYNGRWYC